MNSRTPNEVSSKPRLVRIAGFACALLATFSVCLTDQVRAAPADSLLGSIEIDARVEALEVPLNREASYVVELAWRGMFDRFEIDRVENPVRTNLDLAGSSSAVSVEARDGEMFTIRQFRFRLQPRDMGMAYIDGTIVTFKDAETGETGRLMTKRLELKVIDPVAEPGSFPWAKFGGVALALAALAVGFTIWRNKRAERKRQVVEVAPPIEEAFLAELKGEVDPTGAGEVEDFTVLSRMLRRYIKERWGIQSLGMGTEELVTELSANQVSERQAEQMSEVLHACDEVKFSGLIGEQANLQRMYTLVEVILEENLNARHAGPAE